MPKLLRRSFFARSVHAVALDLIGATLLFKGVGATKLGSPEQASLTRWPEVLCLSSRE